MPHRGLELLVPKKCLTIQDWYELTEARRVFIKSHLKTFTLMKLGEYECLMGESPSHHGIKCDAPKVGGDGKFSLETQGVFGGHHSVWEKRPADYYRFGGQLSGWHPSGNAWFWGLTRAGQWILVKVDFRGESGYKNGGYERAKKVEIGLSDPEAISAAMELKPWAIYGALGKAAGQWLAARKRLYNQALEIVKELEMEVEILRMMNCDKELVENFSFADAVAITSD